MTASATSRWPAWRSGCSPSRRPVLTALVVAVIGAVAIELIRARGRTGADIALAVLFYGGIAAGVVLLSRSSDGTAGNVNQYLFGAITTTTTGDLVAFAILSVGVFVVTLGLGRYLFAVSNDEEYAIATGLPVVGLNVLLAVVTAVTVVVSMRVVGLLLISALMIVPVASAQALARSFRSTLAVAVVHRGGRGGRRSGHLLLPGHPVGRDDRPHRHRRVRHSGSRRAGARSCRTRG